MPSIDDMCMNCFFNIIEEDCVNAHLEPIIPKHQLNYFIILYYYYIIIITIIIIIYEMLEFN